MNARRLANGLTVLALLALIGFGLVAQRRRVDAGVAERYAGRLRTLLALEFRLAAEVLKARSGVIGHFDGIVQAEAARKRLYGLLQQAPAFLAQPARAELEREIAAASSAREDAARALERFKREHAVLRNSLRFLPALARELQPALASSSHPEIAETLAGLVRDQLLLQSWPERAIVDRIDRELVTLGASAELLPAAERSELATALVHARVVRARTQVVQELVAQILARSGAARIEAITALFEHHQRAAQQTAQNDAAVVFGLALIVLAAAAASVILRMRESASNLRKTSAQLEEAVASLRIEQAKQRELSELKSRFVAMVSHEFRTPLSVIMSSGELLEAYGERWGLPKKQEHFTRIRTAALGMTRMLESILMVGQRDARLLEFNPRPLEVGRLCSEVLDAIGDATGQRDRVVYVGPAAEHVVADEDLLRHVLENLLSNALKYSPLGSEVVLQVVRDSGGLCFEVRDRGIGISPEDQKHLFETFSRGQNVGTISGTGLGLAIARSAAELHGGSVAVQSELGVGTQFTVRIPCARSEA